MVTGAPVAWVLNLDAEDELARGVAGGTARAGVRARAVPLAAALRELGLVAADDVVLDVDPEADAAARGRAGRAWCPTPGARARLARAGAIPETAPPPDVLRAVAHRGFAFALGGTLPEARLAGTEEAIVQALVRPCPSPLGWLAKRAYSFAGRGHRRVRPEDVGAEDVAWARTTAARGGALIEPRVPRLGDFAQHGWVRPDGALDLGAPTVQACSAEGSWRGTRRAAAGDLAEDERRALADAARAAGEALAHAGYFGPFGVDAFRWMDGEGAPRFLARSELNARYTMGWAVGMDGRA